MYNLKPASLMFWNVCIANDFFILLKILFGFCNEMNCRLLNIIIIAYQQKKLGILQSTFYQSSLFFYDYTIFHLLIASKIAPKSIDIISIFLSVFFSIGNKESAVNGYSLACPFILSDIFTNYNNLWAYSCYCTS